MIWSQQAVYVICLSTPDEGPILLFPKQLNTSQIFGDYSVTILTEQHRLCVIERSVRVTSSDANISRTITILQAKQWPTKKYVSFLFFKILIQKNLQIVWYFINLFVFKIRYSSIGNIIGVSQNILDIMSATKMQNTPIILNCLTNLERSSLIAVTITCILALESDTPIIISKFNLFNIEWQWWVPYNLIKLKLLLFLFCCWCFYFAIDVTDVWHRICSQRKNILNDTNVLQQSMQIVLQCCREFIKKRKLIIIVNAFHKGSEKYYAVEEGIIIDNSKCTDSH